MPLTAKQEADVRDWHYQMGDPGEDWCNECGDQWPCQTIQTLDDLDAERERHAAAVAMLEEVDALPSLSQCSPKKDWDQLAAVLLRVHVFLALKH